MSEPLRVGIIGCGNIAQAHAAALLFLAEDGLARAVAAADPDPLAVERFASIAGTVERTYTDGHQVALDPEVEAVAVLSPTRFHRDHLAAVAAAGKPLFTEKPLAPTFAVACEIVDLVRDAGIPSQVGFQSRYQPLFREVQRLLTAGRDGAAMAYLLRDDQFWPTGGVVPGHSTWRSRRAEAGGGALLEHSIHSCDLACWLFGPVRRVYATSRRVFGYDVEDVAALTIEHESGVVGTLLTVFNGVQHREERRLEVFLEQATIEVTSDFVIGAPEDSFLIHRASEERPERVDVEALRRATWLADGLDPDREVFVYQYLAHRAFASAVRHGVDPSPGMDDALVAHQLVEAAYRSATRGQPVDLSDLMT